MEKIIKQIVTFLSEGIAVILKFLQMVWTWSFGQIIDIFQSNWQALAVWKIVILVLTMGIITYYLYTAAKQIWGATEDVFKAFVTLLSAFVSCSSLYRHFWISSIWWWLHHSKYQFLK